VLQQRWTDSYGPGATGEYAGKSYWLCTENWPGQNYPKDLSVYYESGGFSNGYVPLFIIVGFQNKVYWDNNSENWEYKLQQAIDEMVAEGVYVQSPVQDKTFLFGQTAQIDVSDVFKDVNDNSVTVTVESNTTSSVATVTVTDNIMSITASSINDGTAVVVLKGTAGEFSATSEFAITVYDPVNYFIEDFETADFMNIPWNFSGNAGWAIDSSVFFEGGYSAKSNTVTHSQKAEILIETEYPTQGKISFKAKASSELNYDFIKFYIDGVEKKKISGQTGWIDCSFAVSEGSHIFKWSYIKDGTTTANSDCAWLDYVIFEGGKVTGIENRIVPKELVLNQNYPNPFNPTTSITFSIPESSEVSLSVFNQKGELVKRLFKGKLEKGNHSYDFNGNDLTSGIYFYKIESEFGSIMKKMIMLK
jgi:hypothetical protein